MSARAAVALRRTNAPEMLVAYADEVAELPINPDAKRLRRRAAAALLQAFPDLHVWMTRSTPVRLTDLRRTGGWPFLSWCFAQDHLRPDLDLLLAKTPGGLYLQWARRHSDDVTRIVDVAHRFGWSANWTRDVSRGGLALLCLTMGKSLDEVNDEDCVSSSELAPVVVANFGPGCAAPLGAGGA